MHTTENRNQVYHVYTAKTGVFKKYKLSKTPDILHYNVASCSVYRCSCQLFKTTLVIFSMTGNFSVRMLRPCGTPPQYNNGSFVLDCNHAAFQP